MKRNTGFARIVILICLLFMTGCKKESEEGFLQPEKPDVFGNSSSMRYGGLVEGNEDWFYYVWEDTLHISDYANYEAKPVEAMGASYLCLTKDQLFYRSLDENGKAGIYMIPAGESNPERTLILETPIRYLYAVDDFLYFINYPSTSGICRVKKDGSDYEEIVSGSVDSLNTDGEFLYFRDLQSKEYKQVPIEDWENQKVLFENCPEYMPILAEGSLYFSRGESGQGYRMQLFDGKTEALDLSVEEAVVIGSRFFGAMSQRDMESGIVSIWNEQYDTAFLGVAGEHLIFKQNTFTEEDRMEYVSMPSEEKLYLYDVESAQRAIIQKTESFLKETSETAFKEYLRLLQGDLTLLRNECATFIEALAHTANEEINYYLADMDKDGTDEIFVRLGEGMYLFHYENTGIYCWESGNGLEGISYEPLSDGTLLVINNYSQSPLHNLSYEIYTFESGGRKARIQAYQHIVLDIEDMEIITETDTLVREEQYIIGDEVIEQQQWQKSVDEEVMQKKLEKSAWSTV